MKATAITLGILGSVVAFIASIATLIAGWVADAIPFVSGSTLNGIGLLALVGSIIALVGAILSGSKPLVGAIMLGVACVASIIALAVVYKEWNPGLIAGGLALALIGLGAIFALLAYLEEVRSRPN